MAHTLAEVAETTGRTLAAVRQDAQRSKLKTFKDGQRTMVEDGALEAYQTSLQLLSTAASVVDSGDVPREIGNMIGRLPKGVADAILMAMPTSKKATGAPELFDKAVRGLPRNPPVDEDAEDPHFGRPVGFAHRDAPRWKHTAKNVWSLNGGSWTWNGLFWEGGGVRLGQQLDEGISPAAPAADRRPLAPPKALAK